MSVGLTSIKARSKAVMFTVYVWNVHCQLVHRLAVFCAKPWLINQSVTSFARHDIEIKAQLQQAEFGTGQTMHEVHLQLPKQ